MLNGIIKNGSVVLALFCYGKVWVWCQALINRNKQWAMALALH